MQQVVLDTNVVLSGMLSNFGPAAVVLGLVLNRKLSVALDDRILNEYEEVLSRPRFHLARRDVIAILDRFKRVGQIHVPQAIPGGKKGFPDPADIVFLELALGSRANCLVTRNTKHFPLNRCGGIRIATPEQIVSEIKV